MTPLRLIAAAAIAALTAVPADAQVHLHSDHHRVSSAAHMFHVLDAHARHRGRYFVENGRYYFTPRTASLDPHRVHRPAVVSFGGFSHVDDLAIQLEDLSRELCLDLFYNYSHNYDFHATYAEAFQIYQVAKYIHDAEHNYDRAEIRRRLSGLDSLFHHVEDDVRGWSRIHHRQIGHLGIIAKMEALEDALHHLMNDVGVHLAPGVEEPPVPATAAEPPAPGTFAP